MKKAICNFILRLWGWKSIGNVVPEKKCIIIGVPHTSAWDFVISYLFYAGLGGKAYVLIKKELFVWPIGPIVKSLGGIPIDRSRGVILLPPLPTFRFTLAASTGAVRR
ncbi:MAG: hypothetical protein CSA36_01365 [Draconibacterium sp.]|nr:MAG: hypothetical protein CSA36_01365 [Draconibacterium sp.]